MRPVRRGGEGSFGVLLIEVQDAVCEVDGGVAGEEGDLVGGLFGGGRGGGVAGQGGSCEWE